MSRRRRTSTPRPSKTIAARPATTQRGAASGRRPSSSTSGRTSDWRDVQLPRQKRWVPWFLLAAAFAGFVVSLYLTLVHYRGYVSPCYVVQGCEQVQTSRFSVILGVPVALLGTVFFALMFYLGIGLLTRSSVMLVRLYKVLAFVGALAVIPLFLIQAISLRAFCSYCVLTEAIMLAIWIVSFLLTSSSERGRASAVSAAPGR